MMIWYCALIRSDINIFWKNLTHVRWILPESHSQDLSMLIREGTRTTTSSCNGSTSVLITSLLFRKSPAERNSFCNRGPVVKWYYAAFALLSQEFDSPQVHTREKDKSKATALLHSFSINNLILIGESKTKNYSRKEYLEVLCHAYFGEAFGLAYPDYLFGA